ncbi:hypothetical protein KUCAC02_033487 [Chaenocephalus aceratus]|nr:hypothetical protein KUCAC02_033487 [Chaenocephalus aceratus]
MAKGLPSGLWRPEACWREPFSQYSECHDRHCSLEREQQTPPHPPVKKQQDPAIQNK